jgi:DNA-binding transcriptional LysR family regulator
MELRQLEYFIAVAEEANFTRGAERVHVAQPGVSAQIRRLERELGQPLFDRSARTVRLTDVGAAILPYARAALASTDGVRLIVEEMAGLVRGRVAIGMVVACALPRMFDLVAAYHRAYPQVEIVLSEANSDELVRSLRDGSLDLALIGASGPRPVDLEALVLLDEPVVAAVPPDHALARRKRLPVTALEALPLICLPLGTGIRSSLEDGCRRVGSQPRIAFEASDPRAVAQLAARGLGVAILSTSLVAQADLHAITLVQPDLHARIEFAWKPGAAVSPAARALMRMAASAPI